MKIEVKTKCGSLASVKIPKTVESLINQTPNKGPRGETAEQEMASYLQDFMSALELAFAAPEPLRRSFVDILRVNSERIEQKMTEALEATTRVFHQRVAEGN